MDMGRKVYQGNAPQTPTGGLGGTSSMKNAIQRRISSRSGGGLGGQPNGKAAGGKTWLSPNNQSIAGSMIKNSGKGKGLVNRFVPRSGTVKRGPTGGAPKGPQYRKF